MPPSEGISQRPHSVSTVQEDLDDLENETNELLERQYLTVEECLQVSPPIKELLSGPIGPSEFNTLEELEACICLKGNLGAALREHTDVKEVNPPFYYPTTSNMNHLTPLSSSKIISTVPNLSTGAFLQSPPSELQKRRLAAYASFQNLRGAVEAKRRRLVVPGVMDGPEQNLNNSGLRSTAAQIGEGPLRTSQWPGPYADRNFAYLQATGPSQPVRQNQTIARSPTPPVLSLPSHQRQRSPENSQKGSTPMTVTSVRRRRR